MTYVHRWQWSMALKRLRGSFNEIVRINNNEDCRSETLSSQHACIMCLGVAVCLGCRLKGLELAGIGEQ